MTGNQDMATTGAAGPKKPTSPFLVLLVFVMATGLFGSGFVVAYGLMMALVYGFFEIFIL